MSQKKYYLVYIEVFKKIRPFVPFSNVTTSNPGSVIVDHSKVQ